MSIDESPNHNGDYSVSQGGAKLDVVDICYSIVINKKIKRVLRNVCFSLEPGDLCAIMVSF
jgi:hypothetical protein